METTGATGSGAGTGVPITRACQPAAVLVLGRDAGELERLAATELGRYIERLGSAGLGVTGPDAAAAAGRKTLIIVGTAETNPLVDKALAGAHDPGGLKPEGFILHTGRLGDSPCVVVAGADAIGTLYGAYALLEALGATFLLTADLLPEPAADLTLAPISEKFEPALSRRGFFTGPFNLHSSIWGLQDYRNLIDQMVKLRLNLLLFFEHVGMPWVEYSYRGEKRLIGDVTAPDTGYLRIRVGTPSASVRQVRIGTEHFQGRRTMAPPEMQGTLSQEEAFRRFSGMMQEVLRYARERGIFTGMSVLPNNVPANLARLTRRHGPRPFQSVYGATVSPTDPVAAEINECRLRAVFETYPDLDYLFVFGAEDYGLCSHPDSVALYEKLRPCFANARATLAANWTSVCGKFGRSPDEVIDADLGFFEVARQTAATAKRLRPDTRIGLAFFFRGYLLQDADKLVDRDFALMDFQSSGVFPVRTDVNAEYFAGMGDRERLIIPRTDDDGSMFGMPFYLRQFQTDGLFGKAHAAGVTGFASQMSRARGTEHHTRFLAQGAWEPALTPDAFYERYATEIFGPAAAGHMRRAFDILEENEEMLGWRGNDNFCWAAGPVDVMQAGQQLLNQANPYDGPEDAAALLAGMDVIAPDRAGSGKAAPGVSGAEGKRALFERAVGLLGGALREMALTRPLVSAKGRPMLAYLISKTGAYKALLEMTVALENAFAEYASAFLDHGGDQGDETKLADALKQAERAFLFAEEKACETARRAAEIVDHPSDLAILFLTNTWCVNKIAEINDVVRRVVNYHSGLPYWQDAERGADERTGFAL